MITNRKTGLLAFLAIVLILALSACSQPDGSGASTAKVRVTGTAAQSSAKQRAASDTVVFASGTVSLQGEDITSQLRPEQTDTPAGANDVEFEADQEKPEDEDTPSGVEKGIQIPGYESITIPAGTTDVSVELMNPEENNVYFEISFHLPETDETIYTSKMIQPGQHLYEITLDKAMEAGEYPLTIRYGTYSADEAMTPRNGAEVNCTLIVQ